MNALAKQWNVLISAPYFQPVVDDYRSMFEQYGIHTIVPEVNERMSEEELLQYVGEIDGMICGDDRVTARVLDAAPRLKVISKWGTGTDSIDKGAAAKRGIAVKNTPNAFSEPVADTVLSFMLCFARNTVGLNRDMHEGRWKKELDTALNECTLGIIGVGDVGSAVRRRAEAFGMRILGNDIKEKPFENMVSLEALLAESDFVSINCDLNEISRHLINDETLAQMKESAYLINTARGPIVDEQALIRALQSGAIAGAGLDVFEDEPLPENSPLKGMSNVIMSPHNANSSKKAWEYVHKNTVQNLIAELSRYE